MSEMKLLDAPENKGGLSAGNAVAHETLEAYASAQGMKFGDAHDYAAKYFGEIQFAGSEVNKRPINSAQDTSRATWTTWH
jgi:hypothetical protein